MSYKDLPYLAAESFPFCGYSKASAIRGPVRDAINTARTLTPSHMAQVVDVLELALAHIRAGEPNEEPTPAAKSTAPSADSDDPVDILLSSAEPKPNSSKRRSKGRG